MPEVRLSPQAIQAYADLEKAGAAQLLDAIDDALDILEASPGDPRARKRLFTGGLWGIPVRDRADDWLIIWEHDEAGGIRVRYLGADPFA
jgi:ParE toxin of type II toxin-antitoxin system, parDE